MKLVRQYAAKSVRDRPLRQFSPLSASVLGNGAVNLGWEDDNANIRMVRRIINLRSWQTNVRFWRKAVVREMAGYGGS
jgi:hypothetical protein